MERVPTLALSAELIEHLGVGLHQANEVLGREEPQRARVGAGLGEALQLVGAGQGRVEHHRLRVPGVALDGAGRRVVAGDRQHVGLLAQQDRQRGVEFLDRLLLRGEVAVLAIHVGVFEVDEEVVVVVVFGEVALELLGDGLRAFELGHADQLGQALVHRIDGDAAWAHAHSGP